MVLKTAQKLTFQIGFVFLLQMFSNYFPATQERNAEPPTERFSVQAEFSVLSSFTLASADDITPTTFLAIGDPHFQTKNMDKLDAFIAKIRALIQQVKPSGVVVMGDLLHDHEKVHTLVMNKAHEFIQEIASLAPVFLLVGNHDYINNSQFLTSNHWMNSMKLWSGVVVVDTGHVYQTQYGKIIFAPYVPNGRFCEALDYIDPDWRDARLIFAHQELSGGAMGMIVSQCEEWPLENPLVVSGHIHDKQRPQQNLFYLGSSMQHAFGESLDKTVSIVTVDEDAVHLDKVNLGMSRKRIVQIHAKDFANVNLDLLKTDPAEEIRLNVIGSAEELATIKKLKKFHQVSGEAKIVLKANRDPVAPQVLASGSSAFERILQEMIANEQNPILVSLYNQVFMELE